MRSKSYSAIVHSSFLLLSISCMSQGHQADNKTSPAPTASFDTTEDAKTGEDMPPEDNGEEIPDAPEAADDGGGEGAPEATEDSGGHDPLTAGAHKRPKDGCATGEMRFEGVCTDKDRVKKIVDKREEKALQKVQQATKPEQAANAAHELLEQQIAQVDKAEDDLDEIIEQLKEEKKRKAMAKKKEEAP